MDKIKRTGPPTPIDISDDRFRLRVPLSDIPPAEWVHFFQEPSEWTTLHHPKLIDIEGDFLEFTCEELQVPIWIQYIDKWIAAANHQYAEYLERLRGKEAAQGEEERERQLRLKEAAEKFKSL